MFNKNAMTEALGRKRAQGLDIHIILDTPEGMEAELGGDEMEMKEGNEDKELGLAPEGAAGEEAELNAAVGEEMADEEADVPMVESELAKAGLGNTALGRRSRFMRGQNQKKEV